ncbi:MAG: SPOR domain-containing protein [Muribaculaceae bacterium]|nr:SPOR domain-containing protein [Muribaculaceae bacterium]
MRRILIPLVVLAALSACKTSEQNYRAAYEKAIAGRDSSEAIENTIYGRERRQVGFDYIVLPGGSDTVAVKRQLVRIAEGGGGIRENLRRYCVVVGQFKQRFNAMSLRDRLAIEDGTMPAAFVVETAEPYYYVIGGSYSSITQAADTLHRFQAERPIPFKAPLPFILEATATGPK